MMIHARRSRARLRTSLEVSLLALSVAQAASLSACANSDPTVVESPVVLGMTDKTPPLYMSGDTSVYVVTVPVPLPIRQPRADETKGLPADLPYARTPYYRKEDTRISVRYTLTNADAAKHTVTLLIDPWNEFARYVPGVSPGEEEGEVNPNLSGVQKDFVLEPKSRITGIVTPDDFFELANDLGTAEALLKRTPPADDTFGGPILFNRAMNGQNRSGATDPLLKDFMPKGVVAGISGFDLSLRMTETANVSVEVLPEIVDKNGDRILTPANAGTPIGRPGRVITPTAASAIP